MTDCESAMDLSRMRKMNLVEDPTEWRCVMDDEEPAMRVPLVRGSILQAWTIGLDEVLEPRDGPGGAWSRPLVLTRRVRAGKAGSVPVALYGVAAIVSHRKSALIALPSQLTFLVRSEIKVEKEQQLAFHQAHLLQREDSGVASPVLVLGR
jgi:hypothetical protein